jgi:hypothetical protein
MAVALRVAAHVQITAAVSVENKGNISETQ